MNDERFNWVYFIERKVILPVGLWLLSINPGGCDCSLLSKGFMKPCSTAESVPPSFNVKTDKEFHVQRLSIPKICFISSGASGNRFSSLLSSSSFWGSSNCWIDPISWTKPGWCPKWRSTSTLLPGRDLNEGLVSYWCGILARDTP